MWQPIFGLDQIVNHKRLIGKALSGGELETEGVARIVMRDAERMVTPINGLDIYEVFLGNDGLYYPAPGNGSFYLAFGEKLMPYAPQGGWHDDYSGYPSRICVGQLNGEWIVYQVDPCKSAELKNRRKVIAHEVPIAGATGFVEFMDEKYRSRINLFEVDRVFEDRDGRQYAAPTSDELDSFFGCRNLPIDPKITPNYTAGKDYLLCVAELNGESLVYILDDIPPGKTHAEAVIWDPEAKSQQKNEP